MKKILLITNIPNPYRIPLYNELAKLFGENQFSFKVIFGASGYKRRLFKLNESEINFNFEILKSKSHTYSKDGEKTIFLYTGLSRLLKSEKPDVIIVAGFSAATLKVFNYHLLTDVPYIIISGTIEKGTRKINFLRRIQRKILANHASAFVAYGNLAKKYLIESGVAENKIFIGRNTVDTSFFSRQTEFFRNANNTKLQEIHFTYLGYLVPRKNVHAVLEAVKVLAETGANFKVDIVGDGITKVELVNYCNENNLNTIVNFHGFIQQDDIPEYLAKSSGFLFQTDYDIWGLVLNEAMAAGLPCIASPNAGATHDLIEDGVTGFIIDYKDPEKVAAKMKWIIDNPIAARQIGNNAAAYMKNSVTIVHAATGFLEAVNLAVNPDKKKK